MADFHNIVADKIRAVNPGALVGGPTAAWMALDANNFGEAAKHFTFLDETKGKMDFYSYHFYDGSELLVNGGDSNNTGYLSGRLEADLDLLRNHMTLTNNVKPMVISETGSLHAVASETDLFIKMKTFNAYTIRYMNRPNEFDQVVPFLLPITWWSKASVDNLLSYDVNGNVGETTKMMNYVELWSEYNGNLVPTFVDNDKMYVHSAQDGNVIYVAMNNLNTQRTSVDLDVLIGDATITDIERTRSYLELGEIRFENEKLTSLQNVPMAVEETCIVKITLDKVPDVTSTSYKKTYYGNSTLKPTGSAPASFTISAPNTGVEKSTLRVSVARENGFNQNMTVDINGTTFTHDLSYSDKLGRFFEYVDFEVPTDVLTTSNKVSVTIPQTGGFVSTVALINHETKAAPTNELLAVATDDSAVKFNGSSISNLESYQIDGDTYVSLPDLARGLNGTDSQFDLDWNETNNSVDVITNTALTAVIRDNVVAGGDFRYAKTSTDKLSVNGEVFPTTGIEIQTDAYFNLIDVCQFLNLDLVVDEETGNIDLIPAAAEVVVEAE